MTFKDNEGKEWSIELNLYSIQKIYEATQIDLLMPEVFLAQQTVHPLLFASLLPVLLRDQLEDGITEEEILKRFTGKPYFDAQEAFFRELLSFFQAAGQGGSARRISDFLKKLKKITESAGISGTTKGATERSPSTKA